MHEPLLPSLLIALYGAGMIVFLLVRRLVGEPTPVDLVNRFMPLLAELTYIGF